MNAAPFQLTQGNSPLLISMPHNASTIPTEIGERMHPYAQAAPDTDWLLNQLYDFAPALEAGVLQPAVSRYVIDLNRAPDDSNLYPGADTTGLCPTSCFDKRPIYLDPQPLPDEEIAERIATYWQPYHDALNTEAQRLKATYGYAIVFEAHSIASVVPRFFEGRLPELNLGTHSGQSCHPHLQQAAEDILKHSGYSWVSNERFKGGYITRRYGQPREGIHTLQLEISQATYMHEETGAYAPAKAARLQPVLHSLLQKLLQADL